MRTRLHRRISTADKNLAVIYAGPCVLRAISSAISWTGGTFRALRLYDMATLPNPAADIPALTFQIHAQQSAVGVSDAMEFPDVKFETGLAMAYLNGIADQVTSVSGLAAGDTILHIFYGVE